MQEPTDGAYICSRWIFEGHPLQGQEQSSLESSKSHKGDTEGYGSEQGASEMAEWKKEEY